ncbi:MAG: hypothetical protein H6744_17050 [Deltaproteobacteria bacterium]|nr:hypothetical protein [Deltaproteobacteria bacterium]MCB9788391.1 hypothetical protein [Deltaproteobacteria bacterium]
MSAAAPTSPSDGTARGDNRLVVVPPAPAILPFPVGEGDDLAVALREQLGRISRHYARDVGDLRQRLSDARAAEELARRRAAQAETEASEARAEANGLRRVLAVTQLHLEDARDRHDVLASAMDIPWYRMMQRRAAMRQVRRLTPER